jgi:hypothetical protein
MSESGFFNLIALDNELEYAQEIVNYVQQKGFTSPFINAVAVNKIQDCLELPAKANWNGEWLFILDCDLGDEGEYGGFEVWSQLVATEPDDRAAFAILYSQALTDFVAAINKGGDRARSVQRPQIYYREATVDGKEPWFNSILKWVSQRQKYLISSADLNQR